MKAITYSYTVIKESINNKNLYSKYNWILPISAAAFWILNSSLTTAFFISFILSITLITFFSFRLSPLIEYIKNTRLTIRIVSLFTAIGVCWCSQEKFYSNYQLSSKVHYIESLLPARLDIIRITSIPLSIISIFFIYISIIYFWNKLFVIFKRSNLFYKIKLSELTIYTILLTISIVFMITVFARTEAFYGTDKRSEIIYTSDFPRLMEEDVYLYVMHSENRLHQPLFAVFSAPFIGIPYLISIVFQFGTSIKAMLENSVQIVMLFISNLMLTRIMGLNKTKRICFMILSTVTHTQLLFILMMEQYIVSYFWLIFCLYQIAEHNHPDRIVFWGSSGVMVTSAILLPFMSKESPVKNLKSWIEDIFKFGFQFILLIVAFCRFDVIFNLFTEVDYYNAYSGIDISFHEKLCQYLNFIKSFFLPPEHIIINNWSNAISWQLAPIKHIDMLGAFLLMIAIVSGIWNRDNKSCLYAFGWLLYSVFLLLVIGWGIPENGLTLYSLYLGWPLLVLLFKLVEKMEEKMKTRFLVPVFTVLAFFTLIRYNAHGISELIRFAVNNYPV